MIMKNKNAKISGRKIGKVVEKVKLVNSDVIPLNEQKILDNSTRYTSRNMELLLGSPGNPPMGTDYNAGVSVRHIKDAFKPDEEGEIEVRDGRLWITIGKNEYWFNLEDPGYDYHSYADYGDWYKTSFTMDPSALAGMAKDAEYVKIEAGTNKAGKRTVFVAFYDEGFNFIDGIDLKTEWEGIPSLCGFKAKYVSEWDKLGNRAKVRMADDQQIELAASDEGVDCKYRLDTCGYVGFERHPRYSDGVFYDEKERDWYMSCNRKNSKAKHGRY